MNIVKLLVILILLYVVYRVVIMFRRMPSRNDRDYRINDLPSKGEDLVQDCYCKTYIPQSQAYTKEIDGKIYYFCSRECCEKFLAERK